MMQFDASLPYITAVVVAAAAAATITTTTTDGAVQKCNESYPFINAN